jgi:hypothetical protein
MEPTIQQLKNTLLHFKRELDESNRRVRELHAAYLASRDAMDSILRFASLSHPMLSYHMRCMRAEHEMRRRNLIRRLIEEQNEDIELLAGALKDVQRRLVVSAVRQRMSPRRLQTENDAMKLKVTELRLYIRRLERRVHS